MEGIAAAIDTTFEAPDLRFANSTRRPEIVLEWAENSLDWAEQGSPGEYHRFAQNFWSLVVREWSGFDLIDHAGFSGLFVNLRSTWSEQYMSGPDLAMWDALPDRITVYRGGDLPNVRNGLSWTSDPVVAAMFALGHRWTRHLEPAVLTGAVKKKDIAFVIDSRNEREVVVFDYRCVQRCEETAYAS